MSRDMRFPTMWYMRPAKAQTSYIRQSNHSLCQSLEYSITVKLLAEQHLEFLSLKGGYTGSFESIHVKMPHCWQYLIAAHITLPINGNLSTELA